MKILELQDVSKIFYTKTQQTTAVSHLSFEVNEGEFVALIGPSGCGKTTILSLICRLIAPTSGRIVTKNDNAIGYMLQRDQLFEWRTIEKNVTLGLEVMRKNNAENRNKACELLKKYGLWEFRKHYPQQLSGGMRQRAALIRTLATDPDLLLLDEPFSALDFQTRLEVCDDVYSIIKKENKTALLVTHDISEAISLADRIVVLTSRPATVLTIHVTGLSNIDSPLKRRQSPKFSKQFELLHKYLHGENP
ncbi:MAG: ABC transporter ATP-binding protein [Clostridiales bacterium]|nr:ABC transporter ATP-binding protein [Clostridiales bacterium]